MSGLAQSPSRPYREAHLQLSSLSLPFIWWPSRALRRGSPALAQAPPGPALLGAAAAGMAAAVAAPAAVPATAKEKNLRLSMIPSWLVPYRPGFFRSASLPDRGFWDLICQ